MVEAQSAAAEAVVADISMRGDMSIRGGDRSARRRRLSYDDENQHSPEHDPRDSHRGSRRRSGSRSHRSSVERRDAAHQGRGDYRDRYEDELDVSEESFVSDDYGSGENLNESRAARLTREYEETHRSARKSGRPSPLRRSSSGRGSRRPQHDSRYTQSRRLVSHTEGMRSMRKDRYSHLEGDVDEGGSRRGGRSHRSSRREPFIPSRTATRSDRKLQQEEELLQDMDDTLNESRYSLRDEIVVDRDPQAASRLASLRDEVFELRGALKRLLDEMEGIVQAYQRSNSVREELIAERDRVRLSAAASPSKNWRDQTIEKQIEECDLEIQRSKMQHELRLADYRRLQHDYKEV